MSYVPHTEAERNEMLARVGVDAIEDLFEAIPAEHRFPKIELPPALSEIEIMGALRDLSEMNDDLDHMACFLGAGAYHHFVPSVVKHIVSRSEFYTAYTPYQPEVSQGTLQAVFEYQTMMAELTGMDVSNASHYDGATAVAEAAIMAFSVHRGRRHKVLVSSALHPEYRETLRTYTQGMDVEVVEGCDLDMTPDALAKEIDGDTACVIVQNPDFLGRVHDYAALAESAHASKTLLVVACNPISLGMLAPPGTYGADVAVGEGQPLGNALNYGGPYLGFFCCRKKDVRRMAGRLVGETVDIDGERGYVLTLSTREQHIRRERATSNICTNQGLNALAACVYLAALGKCGLEQVAQLCYHKAHYCADQIDALDGYTVERNAPFFNEFVVHCPVPVEELNAECLEYGIVGGYDLGLAYPGMSDRMLVCVTEMNSREQIDQYAKTLREVAP